MIGDLQHCWKILYFGKIWNGVLGSVNTCSAKKQKIMSLWLLQIIIFFKHFSLFKRLFDWFCIKGLHLPCFLLMMWFFWGVIYSYLSVHYLSSYLSECLEKATISLVTNSRFIHLEMRMNNAAVFSIRDV